MTETNINEITINGKVYCLKGSGQIAENIDGLQPVLIRSYASGVHFGLLKNKVSELNGINVTLVKSRRVWYWSGASSISQLAMEGSKKPNDCKITVEVPLIEVANVIEIIPLSTEALNNLNAIKVWKQ